MRNGGTHGAVSVMWNITRNSTDRTPVSADLTPESGTLRFSEGQMNAVLPLNITQDNLPEEAEAFILRLIPGSVQGGAEVDEPMEVSAWLLVNAFRECFWIIDRWWLSSEVELIVKDESAS